MASAPSGRVSRKPFWRTSVVKASASPKQRALRIFESHAPLVRISWMVCPKSSRQPMVMALSLPTYIIVFRTGSISAASPAHERHSQRGAPVRRTEAAA